MAAVRLLVDRMRQDRAPALLITVVVFITALLAATGPRLLNRVADDGIRHEVREASVVARNLQLGRITIIDAAPGDGMATIEAVADEVRADLPASVRSILIAQSTVAKSVTYTILDRPSIRPGYLTFQFIDGLGDRVNLVEGRMPGGAVEHVPVPELPPTSVELPPDAEALKFEVALSTITATALDASVGDLLVTLPDTDDPLVGGFGVRFPILVEVVGLIEVTDPTADIWVGDRSLHEPNRVPVGIDVVLIYGGALLSPDAYPAILEHHFPMRYSFRHVVDPSRLDAGMIDELTVDLQRMEATYASFASQPDDSRTTLQSGLLELTEAFLAERRATEAVLTTAGIGPAAVALAAIGALALMAIRRRRGSLILLRGRGGSAWQIVGSHVVEALLLCVAPAAAAVLVATALVPARPTPIASLGAGAVALGTIVVIAGAAMPAALGSLGRLEREAPAAIGASPRRLAFEGLLVGLAIGGVVLLRQRGLAGGSAAGDLAGVDPFLAAVPALVGMAVGIVTLRLYPYPVRAAGWVAAAGRGLVPSLGLRRAERQSGTGQLPLVVLLLTVAIGTFSSTMLATIDRGQVTNSWLSIGAAHRISSDESLAELDLTGVAGVEAAATVHATDASVGIAGTGRVPLILLEAPEYLAVTAGTPAATTLPDAFTDPLPDGADVGTSETPVPAIVSRELARNGDGAFDVGETFVLTVEARHATFRVVEVRSAVPGQRAGRPFILVPRAIFTEAITDRSFAPTTVYVRAPADARDRILEATTGLPGAISVDSQAERLIALRDRPLVDAIRAGFGLALAVAVAYAALAVIVSLLLSGLARARETAHLRSLGIAGGQVTLLAVIEHAPPVLVAVVAGLTLGVAVAWVVLPGLGLGSFTGGGIDPVLAIDVGQLVAVTAVLLVIVAIGVALAAWAQRRADPARAIRSGIE